MIIICMLLNPKHAVILIYTMSYVVIVVFLLIALVG
jgi:hypothetical protein